MVCIQKTDFITAEIPMHEVFKQIEAIKSWQSMTAQQGFTDADIQIMKGTLEDLNAAIEQTKNNGEDGIKVEYMATLKRIVS